MTDQPFADSDPDFADRLPLQQRLKSGLALTINQMQPAETETVRSLLNQIILEGDSYPQDQPLSPAGFADYWLKGHAFTAYCQPRVDIGPELAGAFYIKPNFPGRCHHICNAGFIVPPHLRGQGIGRQLAQAMLTLAPALGYQAVMFNLVFETNQASLAIWQSLGFEVIGRIPGAVRLGGDRYVDALMLYYRF